MNEKKEKKPINTAKKVCLIVLVVIAIISIRSFLQLLDDDVDYSIENVTPDPVVQIEDVEQFSNISDKKLVKLMGKPDDKENWNLNDKHKVTTYFYNMKSKGHYEFIIYKGKVVRLTMYSKGYWNKKNIDEYYNLPNQRDDLLKMFGIKANDNTIKNCIVNGIECLYIYENVNNKIQIFHTMEYNENDTKFGLLKVTYNNKIFN